MNDIVKRFNKNPIMDPADVAPSHPGLKVECLLNPGVFRFEGKTHLLVRVAERPEQRPGFVSLPVIENGSVCILEFDAEDPELDTSDPREFKYKGEGYLSTMSHLRLFSSTDGVRFSDTGIALFGEGDLETFGIEDCRVATMNDGQYVLTYTAVSKNGYGVGLRTTRDWKTFEHLGMVISPANKDCAVFAEKVGNKYFCLNRPSGVIVGGHYLWLSESPDLRHWGNHRCIARTRPGMWDSERIGCGAAPIKTDKGWLQIYHGCNEQKRYCLGTMLFDLDDPSRVIARSSRPVMEPLAEYEQSGFFGHVVFTNGHVVDGDQLTLYYGASDSVICSATVSINELLAKAYE
jgi:predicted GH43/DUF377 family glycosyl hydrolase